MKTVWVLGALVLLAGLVGGAAEVAAQSFDLGGLGFGLLGGGPGLGIGSTGSTTGTTSSSGTSFGTEAAPTHEITTEIGGEAPGELTGSDLVSAPPRLGPSEIPVGATGGN